MQIYSLPFASLIIFFALYLGVVRNENISHFIRFNAMQAILLDIVLMLCGLVLPIFEGPKSHLLRKLCITWCFWALLLHLSMQSFSRFWDAMQRFLRFRMLFICRFVSQLAVGSWQLTVGS
jgi:uncharacterized membrane protein